MMIGSDIQEVEERVWTDMISQADIDGDGEISFEEFNKLMHNHKKGPMPPRKIIFIKKAPT